MALALARANNARLPFHVHVVCQRLLAVPRPANGSQDGAASVGRLAHGVEHMYGVLSDRAARRLCLRTRRHEVAWRTPPGGASRRDCHAAVCGAALLCRSRAANAGRNAHLVVVAAAGRLDRPALRGARDERVCAAALVLAHRPSFSARSLLLICREQHRQLHCADGLSSVRRADTVASEPKPFLDRRIRRLRRADRRVRIFCVAWAADQSLASRQGRPNKHWQ